MAYVLRRTDGAYVAPHGSPSSYVKAIQHARVFKTKEHAEQERCHENETVVHVMDAVRRPGRGR